MTVPPQEPPPAAAAAAVAAAMAGLDDLADRPPAEHVEAFERVHRALGDALGTDAGGGG